MSEDRLNRIEHKIDNLAAVVVDIARVQEQIKALTTELVAVKSDLLAVNNRITAVEVTANKRGGVFSVLLWFLGVSVPATIAFLYAKLGGKP